MQYGGERPGRFHHVQSRQPSGTTPVCLPDITGCIDEWGPSVPNNKLYWHPLTNILPPPPQSILWRRTLRFFIGHSSTSCETSPLFSPSLHIYILELIKYWRPRRPGMRWSLTSIKHAPYTWLIALHLSVCPDQDWTFLQLQLYNS